MNIKGKFETLYLLEILSQHQIFLSKSILCVCYCNKRSKGGYIPLKYKGDEFNNSLFPNTLNFLNTLPSHIQFKSIEEFKLCTKIEIKPPRYKHFERGSKLGNILLTRVFMSF